MRGQSVANGKRVVGVVGAGMVGVTAASKTEVVPFAQRWTFRSRSRFLQEPA